MRYTPLPKATNRHVFDLFSHLVTADEMRHGKYAFLAMFTNIAFALNYTNQPV